MILEPKGKRHIVIVDDEPVNLEIAESALKDRYKLTKLISGNQLLRFLTRVKPDMILLDVQMPEMSGYETLTAVLQNPETANIPVIFLTSQDSLDSERLGFRLGAKDFIRKPFDSEIMLARVQSQMELYNYRTHLEEIIEEKTMEVHSLQHVLTVGWAEMIESRDGTTGCHVRNTTAYYEILIRAMAKSPAFEKQITEDMIAELLRASTLHDIGKIGISDDILKKPGPLDKNEFTHMQAHSQIGADMIEKSVCDTPFRSFLNSAKEMAWFHHERWDGTGYPCALKEHTIPVYVRALSIVDVYDALTSVRPYKRAFTHEEAVDIIRGDTGRFFDPAIFEIFIQESEQFRLLEKSNIVGTADK